ncbi:hypothetical protein F4802DRAFT_611938 [Xylaria palmicola]|nr:hypothetical protein F4802DRAFT_611938 [Xylaria palmicola]
MFDVIWTDPNVELMGQRMLRKEQEAKDKEKKRAESCRHSVSTSSSSSSDRGFTLFSTKNKWKGSLPSRGKTDSSVPVQEGLGCDDAKSQRSSAYGVKAALSEQDKPGVSPKASHGPFVPVQRPKSEESCSPSRRDSVLSKWAHQATLATGLLEKMASNDTGPEIETETYVQTLGSSSFITQTIETTFSPRSESDIDQIQTETHISSDGSKAQATALTEVPEGLTIENCDDHEAFPPPYICPQTPPPSEYWRHHPSPGYRGHDSLLNPEAWKPPHEWDCTPTKQATATTINERLQMSPSRPENSNLVYPAFAALQRECQMMAAATPRSMLANLVSPMIEASDAKVYREFEVTKKLWLFSALHQQGGYVHLNESSIEGPGSTVTPKRNRILALYETPTPGGALHMTIIDPQPLSTSMGPKLRQWLFTNLLINLEQAFRTTWPSQTFPAWLGLGNLRGKGSTIATITVPAISRGLSRADVKTELRCIVNRLLWQEVWGRFVNAPRWWWEEEEIVQECIELGTQWQFSHIIAVKGDQC